MSILKHKKYAIVLSIVVCLALMVGIGFYPVQANDQENISEVEEPEEKAMIAVTTVTPEQSVWPVTIPAYGDIEPWQEAVVGAELSGYRIASVLVEVGDTVVKGQTLAKIDHQRIAVEYKQKEAELAAASAVLDEAKANAKRMHQLIDSGSLSSQEIEQYLTTEKSAAAQLKVAQAQLQLEEIRLSYVDVMAPDDGVVSSRTARLGAVVNQGEELFRLIRQHRLEWRAEIDASALWQVKPGQQAKLTLDNGTELSGVVRVADPKVNELSRKAMLYVDLPIGSPVNAGTFAVGDIQLSPSKALFLPSRSVVARDGYSYVLTLGADGYVTETKVEVGRRIDNKVEILTGLSAQTPVVDKGAGFLADGDKVKVVNSTTHSLASLGNVK